MDLSRNPCEFFFFIKDKYIFFWPSAAAAVIKPRNEPTHLLKANRLLVARGSRTDCKQLPTTLTVFSSSGQELPPKMLAKRPNMPIRTEAQNWYLNKLVQMYFLGPKTSVGAHATLPIQLFPTELWNRFRAATANQWAASRCRRPPLYTVDSFSYLATFLCISGLLLNQDPTFGRFSTFESNLFRSAALPVGSHYCRESELSAPG